MDGSFFLARRYLRPSRNAVSIITLISVIGVTLGVAVLIVVLAVMTGFTDLMKEKLLETQAHFHISTYGAIPDPDAVVQSVQMEGVSFAPVIISPVIVQNGSSLDARLIAIGASEKDLAEQVKLGNALVRGDLQLGSKQVIISQNMADRWGVAVGSRILVHSPAHLTNMVRFKAGGGVELNPDAPIYLPTELTVTAIYEFGKYDFDRSVLFLERDDAADLFGLPWGGASQIYGWVKDPFHMEKEMQTIQKRLGYGYRVSSWQEQNRQLLGVLQVEKRMMFFLLLFIVLVAAFSIANTLITSVYQKTREIGILKAIGASNKTIMKIFVLQGFLVGIAGSVCGTLLGCLVIFFRNDIVQLGSRITGQPLFPKEFYYFNELPAHIIPGDVLLIVLSAVLLCTIGALIPALHAAKLDPAKALRYE